MTNKYSTYQKTSQTGVLAAAFIPTIGRGSLVIELVKRFDSRVSKNR